MPLPAAYCLPARTRPMQPRNDEPGRFRLGKRGAGKSETGQASILCLLSVYRVRGRSGRAALSLVSGRTQEMTRITLHAVPSRWHHTTPKLTPALTGVACDFMLTPLCCPLLATAHGSTRLRVEVNTPTLGTKASLGQPPPDKATTAKNGSFIFSAALLRTRAGLLCLGCVRLCF